MKDFKSKEFIDSVKEGLRVIAIAVVPVLIDSLATGSLDLRLIWVSGAIAGLRFIDKLLHESGVAEKGLTRF